MKYFVSVLVGAMSYGILSTIVVHAYDRGFTLGEVVGSQLSFGFLLAWLLAAFIKLKQKRGTITGGMPANPPAAWRKLEWKHKLLLVLAGTPSAVTGLLYYHSLKYIPASLAIIMLFQFTWIGVVLQAIIQRKRPSRVILLALVVLLIGTALAAGLAAPGGAQFNMTGMGLGLLSAISYSLMILFSGKAVPDAHPAYRSAWMSTGSVALVFILFPPHFLFNGHLFEGLLLFGALLGLFGAFIPPLLYAIGIPHIGEGMASILGAAELPVAVLLSTFVLHEHVSGLQWAGVVLVLAGIALPEWMKQKQQKQRHTGPHSLQA
ncbi:EamA family transporter [Paenibacillus radicis (ex Gao et al. 2016)]|uniref:Multidrug transporter n=1 Tax=Paenibacillus radicis (ex Gao et al. 2016) TaxID=1737354 RepID=A0A917M0D6_9BACL|nr:DMT family transporter [Paenibacillus radicis (ex Gao et al. 2016)]GGG70913.1 multidrug transporter [Paenibacillus radicis (ex Gao et al. 2016)]